MERSLYILLHARSSTEFQYVQRSVNISRFKMEELNSCSDEENECWMEEKWNSDEENKRWMEEESNSDKDNEHQMEEELNSDEENECWMEEESNSDEENERRMENVIVKTRCRELKFCNHCKQFVSKSTFYRHCLEYKSATQPSIQPPISPSQSLPETTK